MNKQHNGTFEPDYVEWKNPFANLTQKEREELIKKMGEISKKEYEENLKELTIFIKNFDMINVLCLLSMYFLTDFKGVNPEMGNYKHIIQFQVEILQALSLKNEELNSIRPFLPKDVEKIQKLIKIIPESLINKRLAEIKADDVKERKKLFNIELFRAQNMSVRNWGYRAQVLRLTKELFEPIDDLIEKELSISILSLIEMLISLINHIEDKINERRRVLYRIIDSTEIEQMIDNFIGYYPFIDKKDILKPSMFKSKEDFAKYLVFGLGDQYIKNVYTFSLEDCINFYPGDVDEEVMSDTLEKWSFEIGGLKDFNTSYIFFGNPIWNKPFIKVDENEYCLPIPGAIISFCIELMESIIKSNDRLKEIYERRRSKFLENKIEYLFNRCFKNAEVYSNLIRSDEDGENDLLAIIDTHAIVIEAKSGKISASARRGAPERLKNEIDKLLIESSKQAINFANYLKKNIGIVEFTNKNHEKIIIDISKVKHILTFSITFDLFGPIASRTPSLLESSLVDDESEVSPSMSLADLEVMFEILETDSEKVHYFVRRSQLDKNMRYNGDEMDLLAFYLQTGFNIGETEFGEMPIELYGVSEEVFNNYYINKVYPDSKVPKPRPRRTKWWQDIINRLESVSNPSWTDFSFKLLNVAYEDQVEFEQGIDKLKKIVSKEWRNPNHVNHLILENGPKERKELIIGYCYKNQSVAKRNEMIDIIGQQAIQQKGINPALILAFDVDKLNYPYSTLGCIIKRN